MSEFEIALLFPLCVASFAAFLFALSPRLYCEGVERWVISSVLRSKIRTERTERAKDFFVCGDEISLWKICQQPGRVWKPTLLEDLTDPRNGGRIGRSGRVKAISRRVAAVWPRGAFPWMPRGLWRLPATEGGPWGRPWRVPRTLLRSSALRRSAGKSASLLLLCLPRNLCNSNSHPRCC